MLFATFPKRSSSVSRRILCGKYAFSTHTRKHMFFCQLVGTYLAPMSFNLDATSTLCSGFPSSTVSSSSGKSSYTSPSILFDVGSGSFGPSSPQSVIVTASEGLSPESVGRFSIVRTRDLPAITRPKTTCLPESRNQQRAERVSFRCGRYRNRMSALTIEMRRRDRGDEELRAVGRRTGVGHRQQKGNVVLSLKVFVCREKCRPISLLERRFRRFKRRRGLPSNFSP